MRILYNGRQKIDKFVLGRMKFILTKINYNPLSQETSHLIVRIIVWKHWIEFVKTGGYLNSPRRETDKTVRKYSILLESKIIRLTSGMSGCIRISEMIWWVANVWALMDGMHLGCANDAIKVLKSTVIAIFSFQEGSFNWGLLCYNDAFKYFVKKSGLTVNSKTIHGNLKTRSIKH